MVGRHWITSAIAIGVFEASMPEVVHAHGGYHEVLTELEALLVADPDNPDLHYRLAAAHVEHGEWAPGLVEIAKVTRLKPDNDYPLLYLQGWALSTGRFNEAALEALDAFLANDPTHTGALAERARVRLRLGMIDGGFADFSGAVADEGSTAELTEEFSRALAAAERSTEAVAAVKAGLARFPGDPALLTCGVEVAEQAEDTEAAVAFARDLVKTWPRPEPWMAKIAEVFAAAGRQHEAESAWHELLKHLDSLPNLDRAQPFLVELHDKACRALRLPVLTPVIAAPAPNP